MDTVLSVGAMDARGEPLGVSNWGEAYRRQGILAPGQEILGALPGGGIGAKSGTSFAAPIVSAVAGLLLSIQRKRGEKPDPHAVGVALLKSAIPCEPSGSADCRRFLAGRVNVEGALSLIITGGMNMSEATGTDANETPQLIPADPQIPEPMLTAALPIGDKAPANPRGEAAVFASQAQASGAAARAAATSMPQIARRAALAGGRITVLDCGCGGGANCTCGMGTPAQLVYALGKLDYDFGTEARRDTFIQSMAHGRNNPYDKNHMVSYLTGNNFRTGSVHRNE